MEMNLLLDDIIDMIHMMQVVTADRQAPCECHAFPPKYYLEICKLRISTAACRDIINGLIYKHDDLKTENIHSVSSRENLSFGVFDHDG